ncbi:MAG: helix-turn-helix domain-containing protein [Acidimicrobiales bacterium]
MSDLLAASLIPTMDEPSDQMPNQPDEVITSAELADMLKLGEAAVMERVAAGELPGRRFGDQWRFSRRAVLGWLDGSDAERAGPGFKADR